LYSVYLVTCVYLVTWVLAGATLVQWNRLSGDIIASAHDSDVRIWDRRVRIGERLDKVLGKGRR